MSELSTSILDAINARLARARAVVDPSPYLKQAAAGVAEVVLPNERTDAYGYLPGAVTGAWGGINALQGLLTGKDLPGGRFAAELFAGPEGSQQRANKLIGVENPDNTGETVARVLGPLMVPGNIGGATSTAGKALETAVSPLIPFRQSRTAGGLALEAGLPITVADGASDYLDPEYTGVSEVVAKGVGAGVDAVKSVLPGAAAPTQTPEPTVTSQVLADATTPLLGARVDFPGQEASLLGPRVDAPGDPSRPVTERGEWTMGETLATGAALLAAPAVATRLAGMVEARINAKNEALFNAAQANPSITGRVPDAPISGVGATDKLANAVQDDTTILRSYVDDVAPSIAQKLNAENYLRINDIAFDDRFSSFARTGFDPVSGVRTQSLQRYFSDIAGLSDDQRALFNEARWAATELDNRTANFSNALRQGQTPPAASSVSVTLNQQTDAQLRGVMIRANNDPVVRAALDASRSLYDDAVRILERRGLVSGADAMQFRRANPNFAPTVDFDGVIDNPLTARNKTPQSGVDKMQTNVWSADDQYFRSIMRAADLNDMRKSVIDAGLDHQTRNPTAAKLIEPLRDKAGKWIDEPGPGVPVVGVRRNGRLEYYKVNNPAMLDALKMSPRMSGMFVNAMNSIRQLSQSFATGTGAAVTGSIFAPTSALYSIAASSINRKPGTATSWLDAAVQSASGGRFGVRGDLLGTAASTAVAAVDDLRAASLGGIASSIEHSLRYGGFWHRVADQQTLSAWAVRARNAFERSIYNEMQREGISNASTNAGLESNRVGGRIGELFDPHKVFSTNKSYAPDLFARFPTYARVNEALKTGLNIIANSAQSSYYRINKGKLSAPELAYETRRLTGDPAATPSGTFMRTVNATIPYSNVAVQGTTRLLESFRDNPMAATAGVMMAAGLPALVTVYSALIAGPDAVENLFHELNSGQAVQGMRVYSPDDPAETAAVVPIAQELRPFYAVALQLAYDMFTLETRGSETTEVVKNMLGDLLSKGASGTVDRIVSGVSAMVSPQTPPAVNAALAVASPKQADGEVLRMDLSVESLYDRGLAGVISNRSGSDLPGSNRGVSSITGSESMVVAEQVLTSFFSSLGSTVVDVLSRVSGGYRATGDVSYAAQNGLGAFELRTKDRYPYLNGVLFQNEARLAINNPVYEEVQRKTQAMDDAIEFARDLQRGGNTLASGGRVMDFPVNMSRVSQDPMMQEMYGVVHQWAKVMDRGVRKEINNIRTQMAGLDQSGVSAETLRTVRNRYVRELNQNYSKLYEMTSTLEDQLSQRAGRPVSIEDIDWTKDSSQFN
jgi:hypothetical protein